MLLQSQLLKVTQGFSPDFGNMTQSQEFGIFHVVLYKIGKTHPIYYNQIDIILLIRTFQHNELKKYNLLWYSVTK